MSHATVIVALPNGSELKLCGEVDIQTRHDVESTAVRDPSSHYGRDVPATQHYQVFSITVRWPDGEPEINK